MTIIVETLLATLLGYLINLASGERSAAFAAARDAKLKELLDRENSLQKALESTHSIRDEIRIACTELARNRAHLGVPAHEEGLWHLLSDDVFQADLTEWLMAGAIEEGDAVKNRIIQAMSTALTNGGATDDQIASFATGYFEAVDKAIFAHPILARWRHQLSLDYLREQVAVLRQRADEAVGVYSASKQTAALDRYCELALAAWDIIDLSNLPECDIEITTQQLLLRKLYMPLRIEVEAMQRGEDDDATLGRMELGREFRRHREAGHFLTNEPDRPERTTSRLPIGERLSVSRRMVMLGDPGGGKTTLLRWMATAYLLHHMGDTAFNKLPDTDTLPKQPWIPVLIRCRDLGEVDLCRCFTDFLAQHLNKTELLPVEASIMRAVVLNRIAAGEAILLVDGLDEITNPQVRMQFCQELERTAARYPSAPIVVTSRIVGYRDMPYRMGSGFEHGVIAELNSEDKDLFAHRWIEVTEQHQPASEKAKRVQELIDALHSSDRIERLTGNPMLLTTLALVKRKVGKLPNRRTKLYAEAVSVLLNWNPRLYQTIEEDEAIPQLEYLAYEMCRRGVQRLTEDEVLELFENLRVEYPKIRAVRSREPREFLMHLEQRSSILIRSGSVWQKNNSAEKPVWEFRHLTFQEYLAALALLDGRYPGRGKPNSLAEQVAPLAGAVEQVRKRASTRSSAYEVDVSESWREVLRLLVAACKDDDVDDVLLAILNPADGEDSAKTGRPRAVLAAFCLADEPNVSEENAQKVLAGLAASVGVEDGGGNVGTPLDRAAIELGSSIWSQQLKHSLIEEFLQRKSPNVGGLYAMVECHHVKRVDGSSPTFLTEISQRLNSGVRSEAIAAALTIMQAAYTQTLELVPGLVDGLMNLLSGDVAARVAGSWALVWLNGGFRSGRRKSSWRPTNTEFSRLVTCLEEATSDENVLRRFASTVLSNVDYRNTEITIPILAANLNSCSPDVRRAVVTALGQLNDTQAVVPLLAKLDDQQLNVRMATIAALRKLGDRQAVAPLLAKLDDQDAHVRSAVIEALGQLGDRQAVAPLLAKLDDQDAHVRSAVIEALGQLGDMQAVAPLLAKLDDQNADVLTAIIAALGQLGDKKAVAPLLAKLDDQNADVLTAIIAALGQLGDKKAVAPLLAKLNDQDANVGAAASVALRAFGEPRGIKALAGFIASEDVRIRQAVVRAYARQMELSDQRLLSRDFDATSPWLDPIDPITDERVSDASIQLGLASEEVRSRYELLAIELNLKLAWKG